MREFQVIHNIASRLASKAAILLCLMSLCIASADAVTEATMGIEKLKEGSSVGTVEVRGVMAGSFNPELWNQARFNLVPDTRNPLLAPLPGKNRNIYAPSAVEVGNGWRLFYCAWDGVATGNDRIYSVMTSDFLSFSERHTVIENGDFVHVCNVNAIRLPDNSLSMICTAYPDKDGLNKPAFFSSPDGNIWNKSSSPYSATHSDIVSLDGYEVYPQADINGMNVILFEEGQYRLYFANFRDFGKIYRASSTDGKQYTFEGKVLDKSAAVNDVKKFRVGEETWYLMGLHMNCNLMWYTLSQNPSDFPEPKQLASSFNAGERYIVALGWVVQGEQEEQGRRLLGVLYGAGYHHGLAGNRIFARWLQKRVVFRAADGREFEGASALGPDRQILSLSKGEEIAGTLQVYSEDGHTLLVEFPEQVLTEGAVYQLTIP
ncbi:MAG TPA: hypothetical protein PKH07_00545 [bacterium]|nr:hypothetical protein [bacterium]